MSEPVFKPVSLEEATAFQALDADSLASLLTPKRRGKLPPPKVEKPRIRSVPARFQGGYLDGVERDVPFYYVEKPILYRTIDVNSRPERGMELDRLFGECCSYTYDSPTHDGVHLFVLING